MRIHVVHEDGDNAAYDVLTVVLPSGVVLTTDGGEIEARDPDDFEKEKEE